MAIFSRRVLQRLIDENADFLTQRQTKSILTRLNSINAKDTLSAEWETVILNGLSKFGTVHHEPNLGGNRKLAP